VDNVAEDQERYVQFETQVLLGENTVSAPTTLKPGQWRRLKNAHQGQNAGSSKKRPGTVPVTGTPLGAGAQHVTLYQANGKIIASSGTSLYKFNSATGEWVALTGTLNQADIYDVDFTDANSVSRKIIADKGSLKAYNDATETVSAITPAADDSSPNPPNELNTINSKQPKYVWSYQSHIFVAFEKSDEVWYSKRFTFDYFPSVQFERWVKNNDYVNGCGIAFDNTLLIPMRKNWGILMGSTFDDFQGNLFLNTPAGVIAPRSIARLTYPTGVQTIAYLSDDGVHEIYDTGFEGTGSRRYSTRSLMRDKVDFDALGLTESEKSAAVGYFDIDLSCYLLCFRRGSDRLLYAYDTRNGEWYPWTNIKANGFVRVNDTLYFAGETGHLHKFDDSLGSDWNDKNKTTGTPIDWDCITDLIAFEYTGYPSVLDYIIASAKQYEGASKIDISLTTYSTVEEYLQAIKSQFMVWDETAWDEVVWANLNYTDLVGKPIRIRVKKKSFYFQIRFRNPRDELAELYKYRLDARVSGN